ncbi:MAG: hypothetical protein K0Q48_16 [Bacillota bacterium]|jgi:hypothetical protein|nr:hypothetical protein [Bacillota bacterium]
MINKNEGYPIPIESYIPYGQMNLIINFRTLWLNLSMWTRAFLLSISSELPNTEAVSKRLYEIPFQLGNILQLIFGQQAAEQFISLLSTHIIQMEAAINAQKNRDSQALDESVRLLYQNADELADFLSQINPFWFKGQWQTLLYTYISMTLEESTALLSGDYTRDIQIFDRIQYQTLLIGDYMANGIVQYLDVQGPMREI